MSDQSATRKISRREAFAGIGIGLAGVALAQSATGATAQEPAPGANAILSRHLSVPALRSQALREGEWAETAGFHAPGDGGAALYQVRAAGGDLAANGADILALDNGLLAVLVESESVNYRMFGAISDGVNDDGVQMMLAHEYANRHQIPVINLSGEFWINETKGIPILTSVAWGKSVFHINELFNDRRTSRFEVLNDYPELTLTDDEALRQALVAQLKPGVQIIPELAPYAGHLVNVLDNDDRIGIRTGRPGNRGWGREELFYVEEEGRIIGDIAWGFKNLTSITATRCSDNYLVIAGGCFYVSGDSAVGSDQRGYHQNGFTVNRSRTIIREQWVGLEPGKRDVSVEPRGGFYSLRGVFDVTLENIRAMPWEKNRVEPGITVPQGTYGIGGSRMLNCTFRNLTAEAGWVAWGVFGTNLTKGFHLDNCRLNRFDVHFHCWDLHISNCAVGFKGLTLTGGGNLLIENTTRDGTSFINFRRDYGAKWDGPIRLQNCTLRPSGEGMVSVLSMQPSDLDHLYPLGFGTSVAIENLRIDYSAAPANTDPCWLMHIAQFSVNSHGQRLFFPRSLTFRNITVEGREQGVRIMRIPDPWNLDLRRPGGCDDSRLQPNCTLICDSVQLEKLIPARPGDSEQVHLLLGGEAAAEYADEFALYPKIVFVACENVALYLGHCVARVFVQRCTLNTVAALELRGELNFSECRMQPEVGEAGEPFYAVESTLGTRFTNCTIHAPIVAGQPQPELVDRIGFLEINGPVRHYHLNTALGNDVLKSLKESGQDLSADFVAKLRSHHVLES